MNRAEKLLREAGVDLDAIRKCVKQWCASGGGRGELGVARAAGPTALPLHSADLLDELVRRLAAIDPAVFFTPTPAPKPIPRPLRKPPKRMPPPEGGHFPPVKDEDDVPNPP